MTNVLVCGGGSGGHIYPALALLQAFQRHEHVRRVAFMGTRRGLEMKVFARHRDIDFFPIHSRHFRGSWLQNVRAFCEFGLGMVEALSAIGRFRPGLVLGTGGYSSLPALLVGKGLGIPTAVLETNVRPGLANRLLGPHVDRLFCDTTAAWGFEHPGIFHAGIPLRERLFRTPRTRALYRSWGLDPEKKTLLVLGGSLGAQALNDLALQVAWRMPEIQIVVSLGVGQQQALERFRRRSVGLSNVKLLPYIDRMEEALVLADVAVCRGGALTLAELAACGVPAVVVPWEGAAEGHQLHNAKSHADCGAGVLLPESELNITILLSVLKRVLAPARFDAMRRASLKVGRRHRQASARILKEVEPYLNGKATLYRHRWRRHECVGQNVLAATPAAARVQYRIQSPYS